MDELKVTLKQRHKLGMTESEVKDAMFQVFIHWMRGQTVAIHPKNGKPLNYKWDVRRFIEGMIKNQPIVLD